MKASRPATVIPGETAFTQRRNKEASFVSDCGRRQIGMHQIGMQTQPDGRVTQTGLEIGTQGARDSRVSLGGVPGQARPSLRDVRRPSPTRAARASPRIW